MERPALGSGIGQSRSVLWSVTSWTDGLRPRCPCLHSPIGSLRESLWTDHWAVHL